MIYMFLNIADESLPVSENEFEGDTMTTLILITAPGRGRPCGQISDYRPRVVIAVWNTLELQLFEKY